MARSKNTTGEKLAVLVSVDDDNLQRLTEVVDDLRAVGLEVDRVMRVTGTITGSVEPARVKALKKVRGVSGVESEKVVQIPAPDSEVQ